MPIFELFCKDEYDLINDKLKNLDKKSRKERQKATKNQDYSNVNYTAEGETKLFNQMFSVDNLNDELDPTHISDYVQYDDILKHHSKFEETEFSRSGNAKTTLENNETGNDYSDNNHDSKNKHSKEGTDYSQNKMFKFQSEYV